MSNEISVSFSRPPIPDSDVPRLQALLAVKGPRKPGHSRYKYSRPGDPEPDRRYKPEITEAEADHAKNVCGNFLREVLEDSERTGQDIFPREFYTIYSLATSF